MELGLGGDARLAWLFLCQRVRLESVISKPIPTHTTYIHTHTQKTLDAGRSCLAIVCVNISTNTHGLLIRFH